MKMTIQIEAMAAAAVSPFAAPVALFDVALVDAVTGRVHVVNGRPLVLRSADPGAATEALLRNRDPGRWRVCVTPG